MANSTYLLTEIRLDKWLWAARFFKTRSLSSHSISGGHVHLNAQRIKPSRKVSIGDELKIKRGVEVFVITVLKLNDKRRPANEACLLYEESEESKKQRVMDKETRKLESSGPYSDKKPDKKQRRQLKRFKEQ